MERKSKKEFAKKSVCFEAENFHPEKDQLIPRKDTNCSHHHHLISELELTRIEREFLRQERQRYIDVINNIKEYVYNVEYRDGVVSASFHSPRCTEITGYTPKEYYSDTDLWSRMIHEEDRERVTNFLMKLKDNEGTDTIEHRIKHKEGSIRWVSNTSTIRKNGNSMTESGFLLDITRRKQMEEERERVIEKLKEALNNIKTLSGLLPICASCKNIRDDTGYWQQVETYIEKHSDANFSHSICPICAEKLYGTEPWFRDIQEMGSV